MPRSTDEKKFKLGHYLCQKCLAKHEMRVTKKSVNRLRKAILGATHGYGRPLDPVVRELHRATRALLREARDAV